jgi:hypothetical protein
VDSSSGFDSIQCRKPDIDLRNVYCAVVFLDENRAPVDIDIIRYGDVIPAGLARRVTGQVDPSVEIPDTLARIPNARFRGGGSSTTTD